MRSTGEGGYDVGGTDLYENRVSLSGEGKSYYIDSMYLYENFHELKERRTRKTSVFLLVR